MNYTNFVCQVFNKTITDVDSFRCTVATISAYAFYYNFGYLCLGLSSLIVLMSIFGGIKESYRWFILNQAIWDMAISYGYSCNNLQLEKGSIFEKNGTKCFYIFGDQYSLWGALPKFIQTATDFNQHSALFLLSLSRFSALYFMKIYSRYFSKTKKVLLLIFIFNFVLLFICLEAIFYHLSNLRLSQIMGDSLKNGIPFMQISQLQNSDTLKEICIKISIFLESVAALIRPLFLIATIGMAFMLILKLIKQSSFQWKHNRNDFFASARICAVIFLEVFINSFVFLISFLPFFKGRILFQLFHLKILVSGGKVYPGTQTYKNVIDLSFLPLWLDGTYGLSEPIPYQLIVQLRIFIEIFLVLFVMAGYREVLRKFFQFLYFTVKNPRKVFKKTRNYFNQSSSNVVVIIASSKAR